MTLHLSTATSAQVAIPNLHILLEHTDQGNVIATLLELPNCQAEAPTREQALAALQQQVAARLANTELLALDIQPTLTTANPWMKFAGVFKDDPDFDEFQRAIQDYRREIDAKTPDPDSTLNSQREDR